MVGSAKVKGGRGGGEGRAAEESAGVAESAEVAEVAEEGGETTQFKESSAGLRTPRRGMNQG